MNIQDSLLALSLFFAALSAVGWALFWLECRRSRRIRGTVDELGAVNQALHFTNVDLTQQLRDERDQARDTADWWRQPEARK